MQSARRNRQTHSKNKLQTTNQIKRASAKSPHFPPLPSQHNQQMRAALKNVYSLNDNTLEEACQVKDFHGALRVLHQVQAAISDCPYGNHKRVYNLHLSTFYNNKAYVLGELQNDQECCRMMERSLKHYETVLGIASSKQQQIAHQVSYIKLNLKYCAILSHAQRHAEAVNIAQKCLTKLSQCIKILSEICQQYLQTPFDTPDTLATQSDSRVKLQRVNFKRIVIRQAQKILSEVDSLPSPKKLIQDYKIHFQEKIKNMYFWKTNSGNNSKNIRKQLLPKNDGAQRSILGVQKSSSILDQFSLSDLMSLDLIQMKTKLNTDTYYLLSAPKIIELVLIASVCYFTIATQTRFSEGNLDVTSLKINQKYKKLHKDQKISKCKIFHLKAIQLSGRYVVTDNDFFTHLINSFNKNYKCILDQIKQQSEISIKSVNEEISQTYYHRMDETSKLDRLDQPTMTVSSSKKKKRTLSKDKDKAIVNSLKKKLRSVSSAKKI